ncbi:MAG: hypothetical protein KME10_26790 [Plectolyngbya sp. WJT66-NPBG17]|jgi:hypothetical protein|nr:hypothetical protein [Plectolyngbya sp. WJT66-NPBG17]
MELSEIYDYLEQRGYCPAYYEREDGGQLVGGYAALAKGNFFLGFWVDSGQLWGAAEECFSDTVLLKRPFKSLSSGVGTLMLVIACSDARLTEHIRPLTRR